MSLLMEALKKAERAKREYTIPHEPDSGLVADQNPLGQASQPPSTELRTGFGDVQGAENPFGAPDEGLSLLPKEQGTARVEAGSEFPPIIAADDIPAMPDLEPSPMHAEPAAGPQPMAENKVTEAPAMASAPPAPSGHIGQEPLADRSPLGENRRITAAQQQARKVFTAKQPARSQARLLGGAAAAVITGFALIGIYYYWQIASSGTVTPPPALRQASIAAAPQAAPPVSEATPENPPAEVSPQPRANVAPSAPPELAAAAPEEKHASPVPASVTTPSAYAPAIRIRQTGTMSQLNPALGKAYQAFTSGDIELAHQQYHKVLQQEPNNRDALLGLAAIALHRKQEGQAAGYYGRLLELDPADPDALAGLVGLQGQTDPVQSESRLKKILAQNPQAGAVHFALGNLYAQQSRWAEAQQSYFRAYGSAPNNADYAFNLAVSLDYLSQGKLALEHYQRALSLAQSGPANFDQASTRNRVKELLQAAN